MKELMLPVQPQQQARWERVAPTVREDESSEGRSDLPA